MNYWIDLAHEVGIPFIIGSFFIIFIFLFLCVSSIAAERGWWLIGEPNDSKVRPEHDINSDFLKPYPSVRLAWIATWDAVGKAFAEPMDKKSRKKIVNMALYSNRIVRNLDKKLKRERKELPPREMAKELRENKTLLRKIERRILETSKS